MRSDVHFCKHADEPVSCFHSPNRSRRRSGDLPEVAPLHHSESCSWAIAEPAEPQPQQLPQPQPLQQHLCFEQRLAAAAPPVESAQDATAAHVSHAAAFHDAQLQHSIPSAAAAAGSPVGGSRRTTRGSTTWQSPTQQNPAKQSPGRKPAAKHSPALKRQSPAGSDALAAKLPGNGARKGAGPVPPAAADAAAAPGSAAGCAAANSAQSTDTGEWRVASAAALNGGAEEAASPTPPVKRQRHVCFAKQPDELAGAAAGSFVPLLQQPQRTAMDALMGRQMPCSAEEWKASTQRLADANLDLTSGTAAAGAGAAKQSPSAASRSVAVSSRSAAVSSCSAAVSSPAAAAAASHPAAPLAGSIPRGSQLALPQLSQPQAGLPAPNAAPVDALTGRKITCSAEEWEASAKRLSDSDLDLSSSRMAAGAVSQSPSASDASPAAAAAAAGFLTPGETPRQPVNVAAFRAALVDRPDVAKYNSSAWWLSRQDPEVTYRFCSS